MTALRQLMLDGIPFHSAICELDLSDVELSVAAKLRHQFASSKLPTQHTKPISLGTLESFLASDNSDIVKCIAACMFLSGRRLIDVLRWRSSEISFRQNGDIAINPSDLTLSKHQLKALSNGKPASKNRPFLLVKNDWILSWPYSSFSTILKNECKKSGKIFNIEIHQVRKILPFPAHGLRVTRTLILRTRGLSKSDVAEMMDWKDTNSVSIYCEHFAPQDIYSASSLDDLLLLYPDTFI